MNQDELRAFTGKYVRATVDFQSNCQLRRLLPDGYIDGRVEDGGGLTFIPHPDGTHFIYNNHILSVKEHSIPGLLASHAELVKVLEQFEEVGDAINADDSNEGKLVMFNRLGFGAMFGPVYVKAQAALATARELTKGVT